jgi:tRNA-dihydrouridine synthase
MDGVTDFPTRIWIFLTSKPDFGITPFFRVTSDYPLSKIPATLCPEVRLNSLLKVRPQLMGSCPAALARITRHLAIEHKVIDLNMGCPAPTVVGHNGGSALIKCHSKLRGFLDKYFSEVPAGSTSIKTRLGFDDPSEASKLLEVFADYPISSLTLHGRTRAQRYRGRADWRQIQDFATRAPFPVTASGDVVSHGTFEEFRKDCPAASDLIIGRGLLRNPWLLNEIRTGQPVSLDPGSLVLALRAFVLLQDVFSDGADRGTIDKLQGLSIDRTLDPASAGSWSNHLDVLRAIKAQLPASALGTTERSSRRNLSRLKMLWNYLRTSLPDAFSDSAILRSQTTEDFFECLAGLIDQNQKSGHTCSGSDRSQIDSKITICHRPEMDWRFSGEPRIQEVGQ